MSRFAFLLFLSALVFDVCVAIPRNNATWRFDHFTDTYGINSRDLCKTLLQTVYEILDGVKYQSPDLVEDQNGVRAELANFTSSVVVSSVHSIIRTVENYPTAHFAFLSDVTVLLEIMGLDDPKRKEEHDYMFGLLERVYQTTGVATFPTTRSVIPGTEVATFEAFSVIYNTMDRHAFKYYVCSSADAYDIAQNPAQYNVMRDACHLMFTEGLQGFIIDWCPVILYRRSVSSVWCRDLGRSERYLDQFTGTVRAYTEAAVARSEEKAFFRELERRIRRKGLPAC